MNYAAQFAETTTLRGHMGDVIVATASTQRSSWKRVFAWFEKYLKSSTH